jgi:GTPase SAR1 family protein
MAQPTRLKSKICLVGEAAVGKTSLIRRYVLDEFHGDYLQTLGTKVSKKVVQVASSGRRPRST